MCFKINLLSKNLQKFKKYSEKNFRKIKKKKSIQEIKKNIQKIFRKNL